MTDYDVELNALQTWIKEVADLGSWRLAEMPPKLPRPVIVFEAPSRRKIRELSQYEYVMRVQQFGKLYVKTTTRLAEVQNLLFKDLEDRFNVLEVVEGVNTGHLKAVVLEFEDTEILDVDFSITYEATYSRIKPTDPPPATEVFTKITWEV